MKLIKSIKPESGFTQFMYLGLNVLLPILVLALVRLQFVPLAIIVTFLAKWRMLAVKPRYWLANIRSNLVDIFVGLAILSFMASTNSLTTQLIWTALYIIWLVWLKPQTKQVPVIIQALIAQTISLVAFYQAFPDAEVLTSVLIVWLICFVSARHFFGVFDEQYIKQLTDLWAWFGATMAWILSHWIIFYTKIPQIALILTVISYGAGLIYYLKQNNKLKTAVKNQIIIMVGIILLIIIVFSDWQDKTI